VPQFPSLAGVHLRAEGLLLTVLLQLVVIIGAARICGSLFRWARQPVVVGEIAAGVLLGPSVFGHFFPSLSATIFHPAAHDIFGVLSQLGLILLLFLVGLEFAFGHLRVHGKAALAISLVGIGLPFSLGLGLGSLLHPHLEPSHLGQPVPLVGFLLFMGIAMAITAIPVLGRLMMELNITRTRIGTVTISAAAVDDACGWILLATISGVAQARLQLWDSLKMILVTYCDRSFFARDGPVTAARCHGAGATCPQHVNVPG
jgi:Kef-type K+ transport system membrane component KefB